MARTSRFRHFLQSSLAAALAVGSVLPDGIQPRPGHSAENIPLTYNINPWVTLQLSLFRFF
jgi:hypothetical protein